MRTLLAGVILLSLLAPAPAMSQDESGWNEYACHQGNYSVENILRGARAEEEAAEKAANKDSREE